ncbi:MAG: hypothetical protein KDA80_17545, partial [Planctomycetaceae bacterium]|nr:hypothetical protein [Planctomycetaceae bacterium]
SSLMGGQITVMRGRLSRVGNRDVLQFDYDVEIPGIPILLRQRQVTFAGGGKSFIVTCTGTTNTFATYEPVFQSILSTFQAPAPSMIPSGFQRVGIWTYAVIGAIMGGMVGLIKTLFSKKEPA